MATTNVTKYMNNPNSFSSRLKNIGTTSATNLAANVAENAANIVKNSGDAAKQTITYAIGSTDVSSTLARSVAYLVGILVILFILSLLVHYFVTPVYSLHPGTPGLIPVPGFDDGVIFWNGSGGTGVIANKDTPIVNAYYNYSVIMDIFIQQPMKFSHRPRILLSRGAVPNPAPSGDTITGIFSNYNLIVALDSKTTDLIVSVLNKNNQAENVIIANAPVQMPFRLGILVMENAMEIYINGRLYKTKKYDSNLKDVKGDIASATGADIGIAKIQNLKIWSRVLSSPEVAQSKPEMATAASFHADKIPTSTACTTTPNQ